MLPYPEIYNVKKLHRLHKVGNLALHMFKGLSFLALAEAPDLSVARCKALAKVVERHGGLAVLVSSAIQIL